MKPTFKECPRIANKVITLVIPDDGTNKILSLALLKEKNITQVTSKSCLGLGVLAEAKTKFGKLPEPFSVIKMTVIVPAEQADELYDYIYFKAKMDAPSRGEIWMTAGDMSSPFELPENLEIQP